MGCFNLDNAERAMVFGAHPDDEIIGPGGTIHNLAKKCKAVCVVTFTDGGTAANSLAEQEAMIAKRQGEMRKTNRILGISSRELIQIPSQKVYGALYNCFMVYDKDAPENQMTLHHKMIKLIRHYKPDVLFTHSQDNHRDHAAIAEATSKAVFQASESILGHLGEPWRVPLLLHYSVENELQGDFSPNVILEIKKEDLEAKIQAMKTQISQTRGDYLHHFEQIINCRAGLWGAKTFGADRYAEPFYLGKDIPLMIGLG